MSITLDSLEYWRQRAVDAEERLQSAQEELDAIRSVTEWLNGQQELSTAIELATRHTTRLK